MGTKRNNQSANHVFSGYTDASPEIEKAMDRAVRVKDFLPPPGKLTPKTVTATESKRTRAAWKRYRIKDHERGHRPPLSKILKEATRRLDTSIILPMSVFNWIKAKPNQAAFIRESVLRQYRKTA